MMIGKTAVSQTMTILAGKPRPNQRISNGTNATRGIEFRPFT